MSDEKPPTPSEPAEPEPGPSQPAEDAPAVPVAAAQDTPMAAETAPAEDTSPPADEKPEDKKSGEDKEHKRKPHFLVTWAIVLLVAGFVDFCTALTSKSGANELRQSNRNVVTYLHNLQPFQAVNDFTARLDSSEYGWGVLNWDAPFNVSVARDRINRRFSQELDQAEAAAADDPSLPSVQDRIQQAWQQQPLGEDHPASASSLFGSQAPSPVENPQDFNDAVDHVLQAKVDALPAHQEQQIMLLGPQSSMFTSLGDFSLYSTRRSFYESQLPTDPDFSRTLATFQTAILTAGIHYEDSMKKLNTYRMPRFLRGDDPAPIGSPEDYQPNIFVMAIIKAPGLLDAYMNTVRLALATNHVQTFIEIAALVIGAILLYFAGKNNCFTVVVKLFFVPLAGSLVVGLIWGIAYVFAALFGKILAAPAIDVVGSSFVAPFFHWGAGRLMEHHLSEKAIEKLTERKILDK